MTNTISEVIRSLPPGFKFDPTEKQLLVHYLKPKILGQLPDGHSINMLPEVDGVDLEPKKLHSRFGHMFINNVMFIFVRMKCKNPSSTLSDRRTEAGRWKLTGSPRDIMSGNHAGRIGIKRQLVFYEARNKRTSWKMHEYRLDPQCLGDNYNECVTWRYVACRIENNKKMKPASVNQEGDYSSFCDNQSQAGAEEGWSLFLDSPNDNDGNEHSSRPIYSPLSDPASYPNFPSSPYF